MIESPLKIIIKNRNLTLHDLYIKIDRKITIVRLSDIRVARKIITDEEIEILNKYLKLTDEEVEMLKNMKLDKDLIENYNFIIELSKLVPNDLKAGQSIITKCPKCGAKLKVARASINGHLWITCEKEGVLLCQ